MALPPRESGKLVASLAKHVRINESGIKILGDKLVEEITSGKLKPTNFSQNEVHPKPEDHWAVDWIFVVDTLNFCFWTPENTGVKWKVEGTTGYFALCTAINRAMKEKIDILNPKFYSTITEEQLAKILRSDNEVQIPLLSERVKCLHEVGNVLLENFEGTFRNCIKEAKNSAKQLLSLIVNHFSCFRDEAEYKGHKVALYKRAQILIGDIWACFNGKDVGYFEDINEITMFADYRVPQTLLFYNVLEYSEELIKSLKEFEIFENGDEREVEIRCCSIHAVELLREYVQNKLDKNYTVNSILIDHFLWDFRRNHADEIQDKVLPFHKTYSIYY